MAVSEYLLRADLVILTTWNFGLLSMLCALYLVAVHSTFYMCFWNSLNKVSIIAKKNQTCENPVFLTADKMAACMAGFWFQHLLG